MFRKITLDITYAPSDGVYCCLYVLIVMIQNLMKGSFSVDLENTSINRNIPLREWKFESCKKVMAF